jgi:uncharacterized radical SAM superfamily Fe-S cluster-containing enzyme
MNQLVIETLKPLGVPVAFQKYKGTETTYISFSFYNEIPKLHADDVEKATGYYVQIDVWSKGDYSSLVDQVKTAMTASGFRKTSAADLYEKDTEMYHKAIRFSYSK